MTGGKDKRLGNPRVFKGDRAKQMWAALRRMVAERERRPKGKPPKSETD